MKLNILTIEFSKNDLINKITLPQELNSDLAHFLGIIVGDGYVKKERRKKKIDYRISIDGNLITEYYWYE